MGIKSLIDGWKRKKAEKVAEKERVFNLFEEFLIETKPLTPKASKYPEAALLRHAWKRAAILSYLFNDIPNSERHYLYKQFAEIASKKYYRIAPTNAYGKVQLKISPSTAMKLFEKEKDLLFPPEVIEQRLKELACIYIGVDDSKKYYIGQTLGAPEFRWVQHRANNTGPFKKGVEYVRWSILERNVDPSELNEKESYNIGLHDSYMDGYNDTRGNDYEAYERGQNDHNLNKTQVHEAHNS